MGIANLADNLKINIESDIEKYRADTFSDKEPETLKWIEDFNGGTFVDVGANIGVYSLYAASLHPDMSIIAIEPVLANYKRLCENILLNGLSNITPIHAALGKSHKKTDLYVKSSEVGASGAQIDSPVDEYSEEYDPDHSEVVDQMMLDDFDADYIKIDVDGHERDVLLGGLDALDGAKSVLIECNKYQMPIAALNTIMAYGMFKQDNRYNNLENHSRNRRGGNPENIVYAKI